MQYQLEITEENVAAHLDIEKDISERQDGVFTFILRINNGKIMDYSVMDYVDAKQKYLQLKSIVIQELTLASDCRPRDQTNPVWSDNLQRGTQGGDSFD